MVKRLRLAVGLLFLWPEVAGCGGYASHETGGDGGAGGGDPGGTADTMSTGTAGRTTAGGSTAAVGQGGATGASSDAAGTDTGGPAGTMSTGAAGSTAAGGSTATGGSAGADGGVADGAGGAGGTTLCSNVVACGGDVVGSWDVTSSCLVSSGDLDLSVSALFCTAQVVSGSLEVSGTWTANADETFSDDTRTTGTHHLELGEECKVFDATPITCEQAGSALLAVGYAAVSCVDDATTGGCSCEAIVDQPGPYFEGQTGGIGFAPNPEPYPIESYTIEDDVLELGDAEYSYCVSGTTLRLTPLSAAWTGTLTGSVELRTQ